MRAKIVLGLGWGDEGKGITTDYLCSSKCGKGDTINIRFSGGQQAGHTVERGGIKHIFASFGAGTTAGVPTYLTEHCTFYPPNMLNEWRVLRQKGISPAIYIHPNAMCTTPYDVAYNRWREKIMEHGSCGIGVGATMRRNLQSPYKFYAVDLLYKPLMIRKLETIQEYYLREIQKVVGMRNMKVYKKALEDFGMIAAEEMKNFFHAVDSLPVQVYLQNYIRSYDVLQEYKWLVFEGSQGIMLDMEHGLFPNVTYAHTTSKNAIEVCDKLGMDKDDIDVYYVTRCYQTRHGNGWMSNTEDIKVVNNEGETNTFNEWQGNFKIAEIDYRLLNYAISCDSYSWGCEKSLVVTCLDQRPGFIFDYSKVKHDFVGVYESRSPIGELVLK